MNCTGWFFNCLPLKAPKCQPVSKFCLCRWDLQCNLTQKGSLFEGPGTGSLQGPLWLFGSLLICQGFFSSKPVWEEERLLPDFDLETSSWDMWSSWMLGSRSRTLLSSLFSLSNFSTSVPASSMQPSRNRLHFSLYKRSMEILPLLTAHFTFQYLIPTRLHEQWTCFALFNAQK